LRYFRQHGGPVNGFQCFDPGAQFGDAVVAHTPRPSRL
jgi:hypothetical protein